MSTKQWKSAYFTWVGYWTRSLSLFPFTRLLLFYYSLIVVLCAAKKIACKEKSQNATEEKEKFCFCDTIRKVVVITIIIIKFRILWFDTHFTIRLNGFIYHLLEETTTILDTIRWLTDWKVFFKCKCQESRRNSSTEFI